MNLKKFSLIALSSGIFATVLGLIIPFIAIINRTNRNGAIGIIGGADIPTYRLLLWFVSSSWTLCLVYFGIALILTALFCLIFKKSVNENCTIKTSAISFCLSAVSAAAVTFGFMCLQIITYGMITDYSARFAIGVIISVIFLALSALLVYLYIKQRKGMMTVRGILIDILTVMVYFPTFSFVFSYMV